MATDVQNANKLNAEREARVYGVTVDDEDYIWQLGEMIGKVVRHPVTGEYFGDFMSPAGGFMNPDGAPPWRSDAHGRGELTKLAAAVQHAHTFMQTTDAPGDY